MCVHFQKHTKMDIREKSLEGYLSKLLTIINSRWWICWWFLVHSFDMYVFYIFSVIKKYLFHILKKKKRDFIQELQEISDRTREEKTIAKQTHWNQPGLNQTQWSITRSEEGFHPSWRLRVNVCVEGSTDAQKRCEENVSLFSIRTSLDSHRGEGRVK